MDDTTDPLSAALAWTVKLDRADFIGSKALQTIADNGVPKRFVGLSLTGRAIARHGQTLLHDGAAVGEVTSGTYSFSLGHGIATGYVDPSLGEPGSTLTVDIRGTATEVTVCSLPFYRRPPVTAG